MVLVEVGGGGRGAGMSSIWIESMTRVCKPESVETKKINVAYGAVPPISRARIKCECIFHGLWTIDVCKSTLERPSLTSSTTIDRKRCRRAEYRSVLEARETALSDASSMKHRIWSMSSLGSAGICPAWNTTPVLMFFCRNNQSTSGGQKKKDGSCWKLHQLRTST